MQLTSDNRLSLYCICRIAESEICAAQTQTITKTEPKQIRLSRLMRDRPGGCEWAAGGLR